MSQDHKRNKSKGIKPVDCWTHSSVLFDSVKEAYPMVRSTTVKQVVLLPRPFIEFVVKIQNVITTIDILVSSSNV